MTRPKRYNKEVANFLIALRDSSIINMYGAGPYLQRCFNMSAQEADDCIGYWMASFKDN